MEGMFCMVSVGFLEGDWGQHWVVSVQVVEQ